MSRAIFLGSFDPPHQGHRDVIESVVNSGIMRKFNIDKIHIIPTQQNPNKSKSTSFIDRYKMCLAMFGDIDNVLVDDIENQVKPQYTFELLQRFANNNDEMISSNFWWIITIETIKELMEQKWKCSKELLYDNNFIVVGNDEEEWNNLINWFWNYKSTICTQFIKLNSTCNVHSSYIRQQCKDGYIEVLNNTNEYVKDYIIRNKLYF